VTPANPSIDEELLPAWADPEWCESGGRDCRFDEYLNLKPGLRSVVGAKVREFVNSVRPKAVRKCDFERFDFVAGAIAANAIVALKTGAGRVHYSRDDATYRGDSPYAPAELRSGMLKRLIDDLARSKALWITTGERKDPGKRTKKQKVEQSTFRARGWFASYLFEELKLSTLDVVYDVENAPVVFLRNEYGRNIRYARQDVTNETAFLRRYNGFICDQAFGFAGKKKLPKFVDLTKIRLRRVYNRSLDLGGRFYGGFWQVCPERDRHRITINGNRTTELDFSGFLPRAIYHECGIDYRDDPYAAPELMAAFEKAGIPWSEGRKLVKRIFFMLLNAKSEKVYGSETLRLLPNTIQPKQAVDAILRHNDQIRRRFFTQYSLPMMKKDSALCEDILKAGEAARITVLPIHDSFIVEEIHRDWLRCEMASLYRKHFGYDPIIE
jgi:hypothetical protein